MRQELEERLFTHFPLLYQDQEKKNSSFHFECADGWFDLIYHLSEELYPLLEECDSMREEYVIFPTASQIKEKMGFMRFYMHSSTPEMEELIRLAESKSKTTCEMCGKPGFIQSRNKWLDCRCPECR